MASGDAIAPVDAIAPGNARGDRSTASNLRHIIGMAATFSSTTTPLRRVSRISLTAIGAAKMRLRMERMREI